MYSCRRQISGAMIVDFSSYMTYQPARAPILGSLYMYEGHVSDLSPERRKQKISDLLSRRLNHDFGLILSEKIQ